MAAWPTSTTGAPYHDDTLQLVFSTTKGATAICANLLAQRGELDVDAPVAEYWPEFARAGKADIPVRWLLCHKAGLPYIDARSTLEDVLAWDPAVEALAAMTPLWEPGTAHGYHAVTYGWLVGEVVRRITGRSLGTFFADEVAGPLGLEFWIGLPDEHQERAAPLTYRGLRRADGPGPGADDQPVDLVTSRPGAAGRRRPHAGPGPGRHRQPGAVRRRGVQQVRGPGRRAARRQRRHQRPVVGPDVRRARSAPSRAGRRRRSSPPSRSRLASTTQTSGADRVLVFETTFGLGFMTSSLFSPFGGAGSFGHPGAGGSVGFADPEHGIGFGYVMNRMLTNLAGDPRSRGLVTAVYDALGVTPVFA